MSLLLDALKKAADDKQKISDAESEKKHTKDVLENVNVLNDDGDIEKVELEQKEKEEELTLDLLAEDETPEPVEIELEEPGLVESEAKRGVASGEAGEDASAEKFIISDDGLSLLIHKTNRDIKKSNRIIIITVVLAALLVLVAGGVFYYSDMQTEIASLERKHQIAMQAMHSKTNTERLPKKSDIIRNLVSDTNLDNKVQFAKEKMSGKGKARDIQPQYATSKKRLNNASPILSIQKTNIADPVGETLDAAWLSYEAGQYADAKGLYAKVISIEVDNRDALLGLAAIAVLNKNNVEAKSIYTSLLDMDPRDPIATAAIASLRSNDGSLDSDESYLLSMLQKNPDAPHLNFALANIYAQKNRWNSAQQYYFNAWQKDSENADYIFNLAVSMDQLNKKQQAVKFYEDSLLKAKNKQVHFSRETVQRRINELSEL